MQYEALMESVSDFLGYGRSISGLTITKRNQADAAVQTGYKWFLQPIGGDYTWSFLQPIVVMDIGAGDSQTAFPSDFAGFIGIEMLVVGKTTTLIRKTEQTILASRQSNTSAGIPTAFAVIQVTRPDGSPGLDALWDRDVLTALQARYQYRRARTDLSFANPYPLNGNLHEATLQAMCLAAAEQDRDDVKGIHWETAMQLLAGSLKTDRRLDAPDKLER